MDEFSIEELLGSIQAAEELIDDLIDAGDAGDGDGDELLDRFDQAYDDRVQLVDRLNALDFLISDDADDRAEQQLLMAEVRDIGRRIRRLHDYPEVRRHLRAQREALLTALAGTCGELTAYAIEFSDEEIAHLRLLLRRAALEDDELQYWPNIVDSAVQLAKILYRIGARMVA